MNYKIYKTKIFLKKLNGKVCDVLFFIPRYLYKNNIKFKEYIKQSEDKSYVKSRFKKLSYDLFRGIDNNENKKVALIFDYSSEYTLADLADPYYEDLIKDEKWLKKNKLCVEKIKTSDYVHIYYQHRDPEYRKWYIEKYKNDDSYIYLVSKISK